MMELGFSALHAVLYAVIFSAFTLGTLALNPRIWLHDYPDSIQKRVPCKTEQEKRQSSVLAVFFLLIFAGYPLVTLWLYQGAVTFWGAFLHLLILFQFANLIDLLVLDWLIFCTLTPRWVIMPGSTVADGYKDYRFHFIGYLKGVGITTGAALLFAGLFALLN